MKRIIASLLILLVVVFVCVACGSATKQNEGGVGDTITDDDKLFFTLTSVEEYVDNVDDLITDEPEAGHMYVVLNITAENKGSSDDYINPFYYEAYCDDVSVDTGDIDPLLYSYKGKSLSGDIAAGKKTIGTVVLHVDEDWETIDFIYDDFGDKVTFTINRSDLD